MVGAINFPMNALHLTRLNPNITTVDLMRHFTVLFAAFVDKEI